MPSMKPTTLSTCTPQEAEDSFYPLKDGEELHQNFFLRRALHVIWGFRQFRILPQQVSRVKSKIELNTENKTFIVSDKKNIFPRIRYLCLIICNSLAIIINV